MTVENACARLKKITLPKQGDNKPTSSDVNMGTILFELYVIFKEFESHRQHLAPESVNSKTKDFHKWFIRGVTHWLDISVYKAVKRIEKAIEIDQLQPADDKIKYSTSAIDTLSIFYQIEKFWQDLDWPDIDASYAFLTKIVDGTYQCCVFYADTMLSRMENLQKSIRNLDGNKFKVTTEWCLSINNIEHIVQSVPSIIKKLNVGEVIKKLEDSRGSEHAAKCDLALKLLRANQKEILHSKHSTLIEFVVKKMSSTIAPALLAASENLHQNPTLLDQLISYLDDSLKILDADLTETNFKSVLTLLWSNLLAIANDIIQANV